MAKSVLESPNYEEFFGLVDNEISDDEFESDEKDEKIKKMVLIALSILQEFYLLHQYDSEYYILTDAFEEEIQEFNTELKEILRSLFSNYVQELQTELDGEWSIPTGTVNFDVDIEPTINSAVDTVTDTLYSDLKNKAHFYSEVAITTGIFSLHANFRRAIRRLGNQVAYNAQYTRNRVQREYLSFVYGQEALFYWRVSGKNTCAWCYDLEAMGAMPLSWFPIDHPNGMCWLEPVLPDVYSDDYLELR